jgi:pantoate--beta-alanine ligase
LTPGPALAELRAGSKQGEAFLAREQLEVVRTVGALRAAVAGWRKNGQTVALVPTMGALHAGHLALVRRAGRQADRTLVSIFVNPSQFGPHEDLARYPRDEAADLAKLGAERCHLVWAPTANEMYPEGFATRVVPGGAALELEGAFRPHFFSAVATVCCKLFSAAAPDIALFGEKDYQQLCVIRQMVRDLDLPLKIVAEPTVREADGLALSSRNAYLTTEQRAVAPALHATLAWVAEKAAAVARGGGNVAARRPRPAPLLRDPREPPIEPQLPELDALCADAQRRLEAAGFTKIDYVAVREADTLKVVSTRTSRPLRVLAAAWLGATRLIDNVAG